MRQNDDKTLIMTAPTSETTMQGPTSAYKSEYWHQWLQEQPKRRTRPQKLRKQLLRCQTRIKYWHNEITDNKDIKSVHKASLQSTERMANRLVSRLIRQPIKKWRRKGWKREKFIDVYFRFTTRYDGNRALQGPQGSEDMVTKSLEAEASRRPSRSSGLSKQRDEESHFASRQW